MYKIMVETGTRSKYIWNISFKNIAYEIGYTPPKKIKVLQSHDLVVHVLRRPNIGIRTKHTKEL